MAQDYNDLLQVFDHVKNLLDDNKATLGIRYVAEFEDELIPEYPAMLISAERPVEREQHATQMFLVTFYLDIFIFHAELTESKAIRSRTDIELATGVRKFLHQDKTLGGHIVFGFVNGEFPGQLALSAGPQVISTRLTWQGENRVRYQDS